MTLGLTNIKGHSTGSRGGWKEMATARLYRLCTQKISDSLLTSARTVQGAIQIDGTSSLMPHCDSVLARGIGKSISASLNMKRTTFLNRFNCFERRGRHNFSCGYSVSCTKHAGTSATSPVGNWKGFQAATLTGHTQPVALAKCKYSSKGFRGLGVLGFRA